MAQLELARIIEPNPTEFTEILKQEKDLTAWDEAFDNVIDLSAWPYDHRLSLVSNLNHTKVKSRPLFLAAKRLFDLAFALTLGLLLLPFLIGIAIALKLDSPGPIFFTQARVGLRLKVFRIYKFRSMFMDLPKVEPVYDLTLRSYRRPRTDEDPRITKMGRFMRRWSIDELPQLINIILGDMTLIGPRPLSIEEALKIPQDAFCRYSVLPGLTGLAQVKCRSAVIDPARFRWDVDYLKNLGPWQEVKIFFQTFGALRDKG